MFSLVLSANAYCALGFLSLGEVWCVQWSAAGGCTIASIYLDMLLSQLQDSGVGCTLDGLYAGAFAYADDIVLLAPSLSSLRLMLSTCEEFAASHGLSFKPSKSQLIQVSLAL